MFIGDVFIICRNRIHLNIIMSFSWHFISFNSWVGRFFCCRCWRSTSGCSCWNYYCNKSVGIYIFQSKQFEQLIRWRYILKFYWTCFLSNKDNVSLSLIAQCFLLWSVIFSFFTNLTNTHDMHMFNSSSLIGICTLQWWWIFLY